MKLWLILYTASGIGGTWGPLPYGMSECRERRAEFIRLLRDGEKTHPHLEPKTRHWRMECEFRDERPALSPSTPDSP